ncbi:MAG: FAD-dependent thymidylate synthase [Actinomycetota bacterium]|jgi:thymidylate synthase ThyX|nr:FAD-dependent thymidylate synthase [Actinomycetota bacterium]
MLPYAEERFTDDEADVLRRYVTNLEGPVFALVNLPEVVKGALFARYSRSSKSLRRLFLDEFVGDLDVRGDAGVDATVGLKRAEALYDRVFLEYGDDSVAQLGGVHLACEQASNVLTKVLERGRLMAYLEQSTRYIGYDSRLPTGHYRYHRDPEVLASALGARYVGDMDRMFDTYASLLPALTTWLGQRFPRHPGEAEIPHRSAVRAKALDLLRGLLPAGSLSNVGVYGSAQSYERLVMRLRAHPLPEARNYAELVLDELRKVVPSFLSRLDRPERGGAWVAHLQATAGATEEIIGRLWPDAVAGTRSRPRADARSDDGAAPDARGPGSWHAGASGNPGPPSVQLLEWDPDGEAKVLAAACYEHSTLSGSELARRVADLGPAERDELLSAYVGERTNRRHLPGRAFERTSYRFEVICDYGAFRDLQRHRLLTIEWQPLTPALGAGVPELVEEAGFAGDYRASLDRSHDLYTAMASRWPAQATYAVALGYRVRFSLQLNAREAMHLIELRSGRQGHPAYRSVAHQMHRLIAEQAGHRALARAMAFVDYSAPDLERMDAETRSHLRRTVLPGSTPAAVVPSGAEPATSDHAGAEAAGADRAGAAVSP